MKRVIFYYTGTGNSLWCARYLAEQLGDSALVPMGGIKSDVIHVEADQIGLVFPVHMWGVPHMVIEFIRRLEIGPAKYYFAVAVNAGQVSATLLQLKKIMLKRKMHLNLGFSLVFPTNYLPWGGPGSKEFILKRISAAERKINHQLLPHLKAQTVSYVESGPLWQKIIFSLIYKLTYSKIAQMDKQFWVDERCNKCSICVRICPVANIKLGKSYPEWKHHCEQCLACIQWCPQKAIQVGKHTANYERYHHPEIKLNDMLLSKINGEDL